MSDVGRFPWSQVPAHPTADITEFGDVLDLMDDDNRFFKLQEDRWLRVRRLSGYEKALLEAQGQCFPDLERGLSWFVLVERDLVRRRRFWACFRSHTKADLAVSEGLVRSISADLWGSRAFSQLSVRILSRTLHWDAT